MWFVNSCVLIARLTSFKQGTLYMDVVVLGDLGLRVQGLALEGRDQGLGYIEMWGLGI